MMLAPMVIAVLAPVVFRQPGYDPATDFAPVSQVAKFQFAFAVAVDHPARDLAAYFEWVRAAPGRDAFGTIGQAACRSSSACLWAALPVCR